MLHTEATVPIFTDLIYGTLYPAMMDRGRGRDNALAIAEWKPRRTAVHLSKHTCSRGRSVDARTSLCACIMISPPLIPYVYLTNEIGGRPPVISTSLERSQRWR